MNLGDLVTYWFAGKYPCMGIVVKKWDWNTGEARAPLGTYMYSIEILENNGRVSMFDIHEGDSWEVHSETG